MPSTPEFRFELAIELQEDERWHVVGYTLSHAPGPFEELEVVDILSGELGSSHKFVEAVEDAQVRLRDAVARVLQRRGRQLPLT